MERKIYYSWVTLNNLDDELCVVKFREEREVRFK